MKKKLTTAEICKQTEQYIEFLTKRLASANYKANVSEAEYAETKAKLDKAKTRLKLLQPKR